MLYKSGSSCAVAGSPAALTYGRAADREPATGAINHDVKGLSKYTPVIEVVRTGSGLRTVPLRPAGAYYPTG